MAGLSDFAKLLLPPATGASPRHVTGWRWAVVLSVFILLGNAAGGRGWIPIVPAFAQAAEVRILLELQYAEVIRGLQDEICKSSGRSKTTLQNTVEDYQRRYRELTGKRYPVAACRVEANETQ